MCAGRAPRQKRGARLSILFQWFSVNTAVLLIYFRSNLTFDSINSKC
nr:MAG TPA: hypothetical protein [Caudoviricetes sp.]